MSARHWLERRCESKLVIAKERARGVQTKSRSALPLASLRENQSALLEKENRSVLGVASHKESKSTLASGQCEGEAVAPSLWPARGRQSRLPFILRARRWPNIAAAHEAYMYVGRARHVERGRHC